MKLLSVNYHYVGMENYKYPGINSLDEETFYKHVIFLKSNFDLIGLNDLNNLQDNGNYCLITFDDGLMCHFEKVYPMMKTYNFPAAFFISTKPLIEKKAISIHKSQYVRSYLNPKIIDSEIEKFFESKTKLKLFDFPESLIRKHYRYDELAIGRQKYILNYILNETERCELIDELFNQIQKNEKKFIDDWYLNENEIKKLNDKFQCIGSHSHSHSPLAKMKINEVKNELKKSKEYLEKIIDAPLKVLSYPLGNPEAVSRREAKIARKLAYEFAFTMEREINRSLSDPLLLSRIDCNDLPKVGKKPIFSFDKDVTRKDGTLSYRSHYK